MLFTYILESLKGLAVAGDGFIPHCGRAHPKSAVTVKCFINHHWLQRFAVLCNADDFVFVTLKMSVFAGNYFVHKIHLSYVLAVATELTWGQSRYLAEHFVEVGRVIESAVNSNVEHIAVGRLAQHNHCHFNAL